MCRVEIKGLLLPLVNPEEIRLKVALRKKVDSVEV